jgi:hypothetical protein
VPGTGRKGRIALFISTTRSGGNRHSPDTSRLRNTHLLPLGIRRYSREYQVSGVSKTS